jgi:hypothetical protein
LKWRGRARILVCMQPQLLSLEETCDYCGATLEVSAAEVAGGKRLHPYVCPQCSKTHSVMCAGHPHVRVLKPRTDGKGNNYQETLF